MLRTSLSSTARRALRFPVSSSRTAGQPLAFQPTSFRSLAHRPYIKPSNSSSFSCIPENLLSRPISQDATLPQRLRKSFRSMHISRARRNIKPAPPNATENAGSAGAKAAAEAEPTSLGGRLKKLGREYGWSALGVYFLLSALDFPLCYLLVTWLGADRIGHWEDVVVTNVKKLIPDSVEKFWHEWRASMKTAEQELTGNDAVSEGVEMAGWGVEEATENNKTDASLATRLALAYAIHKSFIFVRVPLTAAVTPKVVKMLRGWGWDIGKRTTKEAKAAKRASLPPKIKKARLLGRKSR
ncbi:hypothetical protein PZA11_004126 [Diplocarpon coronariae]